MSSRGPGLLVAALALLAPAPALAADPIAEFHLPPKGFVVTKVTLKAGQIYPMQISGTRRKDIPNQGVHYVHFNDAFFCYAHGKEFASGECVDDDPQEDGVVKRPSDTVALNARTGEPTSQPLMAFLTEGEPSRINPAWKHPAYNARDDHLYNVKFQPKTTGKLTLVTSETCTSGPCSGEGYDVKIFPPEGEDPCAPTRAVANASAVNEVRAVVVQPGVEYHKAGTPPECWFPVTKDTVLQQGDEISCDPDGAVTLQFADNSTVVVRNTTQLKIASFFTEGGVIKTEILLKMGEVAAQVHKSEATKSDFKIKSPTSVASTRGTTFNVFYDPGSRATLTTVFEGAVDVDPVKAGLASALVETGKEVEVTPSAISKVAAAGKAGARNGVGRLTALQRVLKIVARANGPCKVSTPRTGAFAVKPVSGGWGVSVKLTGKNKGTARWTVKGKRTKAVNALAKRVAKRCG